VDKLETDMTEQTDMIRNTIKAMHGKKDKGTKAKTGKTVTVLICHHFVLLLLPPL